MPDARVAKRRIAIHRDGFGNPVLEEFAPWAVFSCKSDHSSESYWHETSIFLHKTEHPTHLPPTDGQLNPPCRSMIQNGILNPHVLDLVARIRHTNTLVISDWAFPYWPQIETVDISLTKGIPTVLDVLELLKGNFKIGRVWQAEEFLTTNSEDVIDAFDDSFVGIPDVAVERLPHVDFKHKVPDAIGLIRTGDPTAYGNLIIESA